MNEDIKQLGVEALRDLYNNLTGIKQFALEQAPDICQQMVALAIWNGVALLVLWSVVTLAAAYLAVKASTTKDAIWLGPSVVSAVLLLFLTIGLIMTFFTQTFPALVAPKLYILQQISGMVK